MRSLLDYALVGGALLASILYAIVALGPRSWRARIATALAACGLARFAPDSSAACGGCDNCGPPVAKDASETRIRPEEIGRRKT